ncbi:MAG: methyltransferase domain-containing protein [Opitutales bacterium]
MPRDWNSAYEKDDTPWDKGSAAPPLSEFLGKHRVQGKILVPGCGTGHDVRLLASQGAEVTGLDIAPAALRKAERFPAAGNERYALGDFLNLDQKHQAAFDWVFEHTCLCAIEPTAREDYARALKLALKPGGQFLAIFFRAVPDYEGDGPPHPISAAEIDHLFGEHFELLESFVPGETYPDRPPGAEEVRWMRLLAKADSPLGAAC